MFASTWLYDIRQEIQQIKLTNRNKINLSKHVIFYFHTKLCQGQGQTLSLRIITHITFFQS
jgi:hypothetical protein